MPLSLAARHFLDMENGLFCLRMEWYCSQHRAHNHLQLFDLELQWVAVYIITRCSVIILDRKLN